MALWTTGDNQTAGRRNREAIIGRLGLPLYDVNEAQTVTATPVRATLALPTTLTTIWTVPSTVAVGHVTTITLCNTASTPQVPYLYVMPPGGSGASAATQIFTDTLQPGERIQIRVPYFLAANGLIRGISNVTPDVVSVRIDALTYDTNPAGVVLKVIEGTTLTTTEVAAYTVPASGVTQALFLGATLCNTDSVSWRPRVYIVPQGVTRTVAHQIWHESLAAKESVWLAGVETMIPNEMIQVVANVAGLVSVRLTVLELA